MQILRQQVDRVGHVVRALAGADRGALEVQRGLGHAALADRGVALLLELDLHLRKGRELAPYLRELLLDSLLELVADRQVAPLDLDAHAALLEASWQLSLMVVLQDRHAKPRNAAGTDVAALAPHIGASEQPRLNG